MWQDAHRNLTKSMQKDYYFMEEGFVIAQIS